MIRAEVAGASETEPLTVLYDAHCRVCRRVAGRLAGMDRERRLRFVALQRAAQEAPAIARLAAERDLAASVHVVAPDGTWTSGGAAMLKAMERIPSLRWLPRLAGLPLVRRLVEPAYEAFAARRGRFAWLAGDFGGRPRTRRCCG